MKTQQIAILFDKSGSMNGKQEFAVNAMNEQVQTLRERSEEFDILVTLVHFNHNVEFILTNAPAAELQEIPLSAYQPNGGTALRDAIGVTIDTLTKECPDGDGDFLVIVITDGEDTSSSIFNQSHMAEKIQTMKDKGWTFTYLGTDESLETAKAMNIDNVASFGGPRGVTGMVGPEGAIAKKAVTYASQRVGAGMGRYFEHRESEAVLCSDGQAPESKAFGAFFNEEEDRKLAEKIQAEED